MSISAVSLTLSCSSAYYNFSLLCWKSSCHGHKFPSLFMNRKATCNPNGFWPRSDLMLLAIFFFLKCSLFPWNLWWFSRCFPIYLALPSGLFCIHIFDASVFLGFHSRSSLFSLHIPHALLPYSPTSLLNLIHSCNFAAICVFSPCSSLDL